ncbi:MULTISPECIES: hypothetical protein [Halomicrobium]|uniref:Uncharacterized protein n=2 Tax=Halomicrobium mukohataei TaxID=57705 RepID=C7P4E4_HALMD|nr:MULTISPECIES: hypothetical protein [Halomicrobium]ACV47966.1 hypothetical protein Hmuk_1852 [Halomicrobium mukohataei DSM 12286]QCD66403.1 hypothetical protein E5139_12380 [Halomicrobium mukohataei]QFR21208.1 hypothetical protein GBQ70_12390 [Halomicrobium sp. ZPS1]
MGQADVTCTKCGTAFQVDTRYFQIYGEEPFCQDCLIHTECQSCGRGLRLQPSRYQELGGNPVVCTDCDGGQPAVSTSQTSTSGAPSTRSSASGTSSTQTSTSGTFWSGLSIGEKIVFPILLAGFVGMVALALLANANGGEFASPAIGGVGFLLFWLYRRGKKNR